MINYLMQIFCKHEWKEECLCGELYKDFCPSRKKFNDCKTHYPDSKEQYDCDYYYISCIKCGKQKSKHTL